jgi:hypothetical protein
MGNTLIVLALATGAWIYLATLIYGYALTTKSPFANWVSRIILIFPLTACALSFALDRLRPNLGLIVVGGIHGLILLPIILLILAGLISGSNSANEEPLSREERLYFFRRKLRNALNNLALPATNQIAIAGFANMPAESVDDFRLALVDMGADGIASLPEVQRTALTSVRAAIDQLRTEDFQGQTDDVLHNEAWRFARESAGEVLAVFGWTLVEMRLVSKRGTQTWEPWLEP